MSNLSIARNKKRIHKHFLSVLALCLVFTLLMVNALAGNALAASVGDVVTQITNDNLGSPEFNFGQEDATGHGFDIHAGMGDIGSGGCQLSVLGPAQPDEIQIMIDYVDSVSQVSYMQTTQLKGCKVREYNTDYGVGIGVILPDYFITVETMKTGQSKDADMASAKNIAQQTIDGMERAGLLSQAAPDIESGTSAPEEKPAADPAPGASEPAAAEPLDEPVRVADTTNIMGVYNGPTVPTTFSINSPHLVTEIHDYHWNNARGAAPGTIGLQDQNGKMYGPWQAVGTPGQGGVPNANWFVYPKIVIPAGTYTIIDSDPATWSQNGESGGKGMSYVMATPHFEITGAAPADTGNVSGSYPAGHSHSPAGVGSVGSIPGPSNITEAVTGVVVPGLIAIALGALGSLGGGGFIPPVGGAPMPPTGGGPLPGAGGVPGTGGGAPGMAQATSQLGRRGREEILADTTDMSQGSAIQGTPADQGIYIETEREAGLFVQPEPLINDPGPEIFIDTSDMNQQASDIREAGGEQGIHIDTTDMFEGNQATGASGDQGILIETEAEAGLFVQPEPLISDPEPEIFIDTLDMQEQASDIREAGGEPGIHIDTAEIADLEMEPQAFSAREGEAGGVHFAAAEDSQGAPSADQTEYRFMDTEDTEVLRDTSSLEDNAGTETGPETEEAFDQNGFDAEGYDREGFNQAGYDRDGFDKDGFNEDGFNAQGYDREGFDANGFDAEGFDKAGFDAEGFDKAGFDAEGFDKAGFDKEGFNKAGFNAEGYDKNGFDQLGFDKEGYNREGFDKAGYDREGFGRNGYDAEGFNREGFDAEGFNKEGFDRQGFDKQGLDREGFDKAGFDAEGYDRQGFNQEGFDKEGFNREGFDKEGFNKEGFNQEGFDKEGFDRQGFNKQGLDREGFDKAGFDSEGFDRQGYDINGYDRKGFNRSGFDAKGYDKQGYDKEGFNKDGWDREGYDRNGFDDQGWDREGYDKNGYDAEGYDRDGYNREGQSKEGYDADGYDQKGFNEHGYDRDGYDREGFDFEGYNRSGRDPWGYDRQGYGKDGYHWSGYNADGYNRSGRHWSENPYGDGSPFDVEHRNPFDGGPVILEEDNYGNAVDLASSWKPTKPPLGEPYHQTVEKYGAKPWTDEIPAPEPERPSIPSTEDTGVIGPEDPMNTLKNHGLDQDAQVAPEGQTGSGLSIPEEDIPDAGNIPPDTFPGEGDMPQETIPDVPPVAGPQHGDTITLPGKDGRDYPLEYNSQTGEWENILTGGRVRNEELDSYIKDFNKWQDQVAEDKKWSAAELERMARREDATSKAIDKNLEDWRKLEQMQKAADKYEIGTPGGPGDVDKAIQSLKDDMLAGKELDQEKMDKIRRVIDHRILGQTTADTGERWNEDWVKNLGWALEANAATAREVVTGEKADGSTSWLGMGARLMIMGATGGLAGGASLTYVTLDGAMNVAEAMYRIKDEIDKGGSDFKAVSKAVGLFVLGEEMGWLAGEAGGRIMGEMFERFPAFSNKAADFIETAFLKASAKNQMWSRALGMVTQESAESSLDQINKRLVDIGSDQAAREIVNTARTDYGLRSVADSFDDVTKGAGRTTAGTTGDMTGRAARSTTEGWTDVGDGGGRAAAASSGDLAGSTGKAASSSSGDVPRGAGKSAAQTDADGVPGAGKASGTGDDLAGGTGKAASGSGDDVPQGAGKSAAQPDAEGVPGTQRSGGDFSDASAKTSTSGGDGPNEPPVGPPRGGGDGPGEPPGGPPRGGDDLPGEPDNLPLNRGGRTPDEVLAEPAALNRAERNVQQNIENFDQLPPARQQELIRDQAIYDEYRMQAEERVWNLADRVQRGEPLTVEDIMEMKSDPASMRTLKNLDEMDGLGAQLTPQEAQGIQREFNSVMDEYVHQPSYRSVEDHLHNRYPNVDPEGIRVRTVRTPGTEPTDFNINTDNDVIAERLVNGPHGPEWVEIPKAEWEDTYYKALAENSGFSAEEAGRRFPDTDWANMDEAAQYRQWAKHHEEAAMDQFDLSAGRDFSDQRTWRIPDGDLPGRPMIELTEDEIARGVDFVTIDGRPMRPSTGYELTQRGQGTMLDPEQLSLMEQHKFDDYWNAGDTPAQVMRNQTEAMEQLRKTASVAETVESSYRDMGYRVEAMPDNMKQAIAVIRNNDLSPAARAARLQELGYTSPGDFLKKVSSRIGAIRTAQR